MIRSIKRILGQVRSIKIQRRIASGKLVYFESPLEEMAFKYLPGEFNEPGKYYAKFYTQDEFEIGSDSTSVLMGVMEGKPISKERYDKFHLIEGVHWNRQIKNPVTYKSVRT
jgi:hypothetical protein